MAIDSSKKIVNAAASQWGADPVLVKLGADPVQVASADANRRVVTVVNDASSVGDLWLVPNAGQRRGGVRLTPGAGFSFSHASSVHGYTVGGDATAYVVTESGAVGC